MGKPASGTLVFFSSSQLFKGYLVLLHSTPQIRLPYNVQLPLISTGVRSLPQVFLGLPKAAGCWCSIPLYEIAQCLQMLCIPLCRRLTALLPGRLTNKENALLTVLEARRLRSGGKGLGSVKDVLQVVDRHLLVLSSHCRKNRVVLQAPAYRGTSPSTGLYS